MYKKVLISILSVFLAGCSVSGSAEKREAPVIDRELVIWTATDLHYISPELTDFGSRFMDIVESADGKLTEKTPEILDELVKQTIEAHPDALILTGDLTFNGEKQSLLDLREKFMEIQNAGIPVLVISGNHDIMNSTARRYEGEHLYETEIISQKEFTEIMGDFGYYNAFSRDESSFSYAYALTNDLWILTLDANTEANPGSVSTETLRWAETVFKKAKEENARIITCTHQNVLKQSEMVYMGYVIWNFGEIASLMRYYDVLVNLSGHSHLQHTSEENGLTDICTESICLYPIPYGELVISRDRNSFRYEQKNLGILAEESMERFRSTHLEQLENMLENYDLTDEQKKIMIDFSVDLNMKYFSGQNIDPVEFRSSEGYELWKTYAADTSWFTYVDSMISNYE